MKQDKKANIAGGVEGRLATQNDMDIMQYILTWDARMPSLMTKWPYSSTAGGENGRKRVKKANQAGGVKGRLGIRTCSSSTVAQRMQTCTTTAHRLLPSNRGGDWYHTLRAGFVV